MRIGRRKVPESLSSIESAYNQQGDGSQPSTREIAARCELAGYSTRTLCAKRNEKAMCGPDTAAMAISKKMKSERRAERERKRTVREYEGIVLGFSAYS